MKAKKKIILQIGKNLCSLALVLIMMICILPQMTVKADNVGTTDVGRILRTFKIKKNVEVTDNGKIII